MTERENGYEGDVRCIRNILFFYLGQKNLLKNLFFGHFCAISEPFLGRSEAIFMPFLNQFNEFGAISKLFPSYLWIILVPFPGHF